MSQHTKCVPSGHYSNTTYLQRKIHVYVLSCVCMHVSVPMFVLLHSPRCSIRCIFPCFLNLILLLASTTCISYQSLLLLGTVKRPLVACLVGYAWVSELCASILNRQLVAFSMSTLFTNNK